MMNTTAPSTEGSPHTIFKGVMQANSAGENDSVRRSRRIPSASKEVVPTAPSVRSMETIVWPSIESRPIGVAEPFDYAQDSLREGSRFCSFPGKVEILG